MEVVLSNTYQIVMSACFSGARKKFKGIEENIKGRKKKKSHLLLKKMAEFKCVPSVRKLMEVRMTYPRLIMYSTEKFLKEFPIKLLFITILTKGSTTARYITFKNWTLI